MYVFVSVITFYVKNRAFSRIKICPSRCHHHRHPPSATDDVQAYCSVVLVVKNLNLKKITFVGSSTRHLNVLTFLIFYLRSKWC